MNQKRLPGKVKWGYGIGLLGESAPLNLFYVYFIFFLTTAVGMEASIAGTISMIGAFWNAATDIYAGYRSDNSLNPKGRRRPFIYRWALPYAIFTVLLFANFDINGMAQTIYYMIICLVFFVTLSMVDLPYLTLASELTEDSDERSSIRAISNIFNYVGMIMASSGTLVFVGFFAKDGNLADSGGWTKTAILFGACALVVYLIAATATKGYEQPVNPKERTEKFKLGTYFEVLKLKPFKYVLLYTVFGYGGMFIFTSGYIYYLLCNAGFTEAQASLVLLIYCIVNIVISMIFVKIGDKLEKKTYVIISALLLGVGMISAHCIGANTIVVYAVFILFALATATFFIHCYAMVYDICDLDYFVSGEDRSGIIVSVFVAVIKIVGGVGMYAVGWILTLAGYDALALVQTASSLNGISIGMMLVPGILVLIGAAIILKYPISKKNFAALSQAVKLKAEGKEYSVEEFKELL